MVVENISGNSLEKRGTNGTLTIIQWIHKKANGLYMNSILCEWSYLKQTTYTEPKQKRRFFQILYSFIL